MTTGLQSGWLVEEKGEEYAVVLGARMWNGTRV